MFIKDIWYGAAWGGDVEPGKPVPLMIAGQPIVVYRTTNGRAVALEDRCSHRCAPLSKGRVEGDAHPLLVPRAPVQQRWAVRRDAWPGRGAGFDIHAYPTVEQNACIFVWTGDPALADPALIPASNLTSNGLPFRTGVMEFAADYQLINDNLCDFSHVAYVHEHTLGQGNSDWSHRLPTQTSLENGIRVTRWMEGTRIPPTPGVDPSLRVDQYTAYDYVIPGVLMMQIDSYPLGTAKALDYAAPPESMEGAVYVVRSLQLIVPVTEGRSRYLFAVSHPVDPAPEQSLDAVIGLFKYAFNEDRDMIEAQQATIEKYPGFALRNTRHDAGLIRVRRLINGKLRQEALPRRYAPPNSRSGLIPSASIQTEAAAEAWIDA